MGLSDFTDMGALGIMNLRRPRGCCLRLRSAESFGDQKLAKTFSAADLGYDGSTPLKTWDETGKTGMMLSPHGTGTSAASGRVYHF
ncbi:MAG: hypothetical protein WAN75_48595 [Xanthobacteraceae bacterium]